MTQDKDIQDFIAASERFTSWCKTALRFWAETAVDPRGGFAEFLDMNGRPDFDHVRRVRVQARQAYVYAHAASLGWYEDAKKACDQAWDFLTGPGFAGGDFIEPQAAGCAHLVNGDGSMHNDMRDTYAQAFILLAGAWRYRAFKDEAALKIADETIAFLDDKLKAENGGWYEALPLPDTTTRRQNPHMHLFEAFLALYEATKDQKYLDYAHNMFALFKSVFFDSKTGAILEFFNADWSPLEGDGGPAEPGHMMEWCWILCQYQRLSGVDVNEYVDALFNSALHFGWNEKLGLICNATHLDNRPANPNLRTWPQTEIIKASVAQAAAGQLEKIRMATATIESLFETYLNVGIEGGWADELDPDGKIISTTMPTSTFYHFFCAVAEVETLAETLRQKP
jgi:mannose-6-phosphate isomerase